MLKMKENGEMPGHSNRVFCVKFDPMSDHTIASEVETTPYNFMTSERKAQSAASMVLTSVEMPSISTTMDTPY